MFGKLFRIAICGCACAAMLAAQDDTPTPDRLGFSPGFQVVYFAGRFFDIGPASAETTKPAASYSYTATSNSSKYMWAPSAEYRFSPKLSLGLEMHFHHVDYVQTTTLLSGPPPPSDASDNRNKATITQSSEINYWEFPFHVRYYGLRSKGVWSRTYLTAGPEYRHVGKVRTGNTVVNPDGTTDYDETPAGVMRRNQFGALAGIGIRSPRIYKVTIAPEVRYVRWFGTTMQGPAFRSAQNQVEISLGFSF
jgi:hypothetical protein